LLPTHLMATSICVIFETWSSRASGCSKA
jgi:hypothetical protein